MTKKLFTHLCASIGISIALPALTHAETVGLFFNPSGDDQINFAANEVKAVLEARNHTVEIKRLADLATPYSNKKVVIGLKSDTALVSALTAQGGEAPGSPGEQAYALRTTLPAQSYWVIGGDKDGAMYGGLEIAENIQFYNLSKTYKADAAPYVMRRGAKLNLSFDRRLPTYSGFQRHESAIRSIKLVWDMNFWTKWLDEQARNRMNILTVWVHNPFPALVEVPGYERATLPFIEDVEGNAYPHLDPETRTAFWKSVIKYAHNRGFLFYFYDWNIHPDFAMEQYPAITDDRDNTTTIDYYKKATKALYETYRELDGLGVGTGDGMDGDSALDKNKNAAWSWKAYGEALREVALADPGRNVKFIHRLLKVDYPDITDYWSSIMNIPNLQFDISMKHCYAFTYASTDPQWTDFDLRDIAEKSQATYFTLRNDGILYNDFGDSIFVREFIGNLIPAKYPNGKPHFRGFYIGQDTYSPMLSYLYKDTAMNNDDDTGAPLLEIERKWYMEKLWGRIGYDKNVSDDLFKNHMAVRYPELPADKLFAAWGSASRSLPMFQDLVMGDWKLDSHLFTEMSMWKNDGNNIFRSMRDLANASVSDGSEVRIASISDTAAGRNLAGRISSYQLADQMEGHANNALSLIATMNPGANPRADIILKTIKQQALLSVYYAYKVRGATDFKAAKTASAKTNMGKAYGFWMEYVNLMDAVYKPERFRTYDLSEGGFHLFDANHLKEFTDLGGTNTIQQVATNGSIQLNPPGWVYPAGTVVSVKAVPHNGYVFSHWSGALTGTADEMNITVVGNKLITPNFIRQKQVENTPWVETFTLANGSKFDGSPTSWTAERADGKFEVSGNRLMINNGSAEGVFETAEINIVGQARVSLDVASLGNMETTDYVRFYKVVDGAQKVLIGEVRGGIIGTKVLAETNITGRKLKMRIEAKVSGGDEFYYFDNLSVQSSAILFVIGDANNMAPADLAVVNRLQNSGYAVETKSDEFATAADANGKALVITSSTVVSGNVNLKYRDVTAPVINWESSLQDDYTFTFNSTAHLGNLGSQTTVNITNAGHPLAAGLPAGPRVVTSVADTFSWGVPGGSPIIIARLNDGTNRPCLYAYEKGLTMANGVAPARRVHLFLQNDTYSVLSADGAKLFDAAVGWALGSN